MRLTDPSTKGTGSGWEDKIFGVSDRLKFFGFDSPFLTSKESVVVKLLYRGAAGATGTCCAETSITDRHNKKMKEGYRSFKGIDLGSE